MNPALEHQRIEEDLSRVQALLEKLPPSRVLERIGFEARRDELRQALDTLEPESATPEAPEARKAPEVTDATGSRRRLIEEELSELDALLARLPERRVLERAGLEARREDLREELAKSELALAEGAGRDPAGERPTMNPWMKHPRVDKAALDAFEAERAERRGNLAVARDRYREAADGFAQVALTVPADYPNTGSDLAVAAVVSYGRAGDFGRAVELAGRMLAESPALNDYARAELARLMREYSALVSSVTARLGPAANRGREVRYDVRHQFPQFQKAA